ncbi:MAG: PaaI family thioesterase [Anaerolineales bacterium]|nr:PaaI family thioesterase [Anaerolineales bacterium]MCB8959374.1 PaaI family thioesterase [Ardenticatenales bacterium]
MQAVQKDNYTHRQPNSNDCFVCGRHNPVGLKMAFFHDGQRSVYSEVAIPEHFQGYPGIVHGGVVAAILDETVARVSMIGDPHHFMMSVKLEVKYRHPVPTETPLQVVGEIVKLRGRLGQAVGKLLLPDGQLIAEAALTLADVPQEILSSANLEALGWYVG